MPTYDFFCNACQQRFDVFLTFSEYGKKPVKCTHCKSRNVRRHMTKVRIARSANSRMETMVEGISNVDALGDNPEALGTLMQNMGKEAGEDLPPEFNDIVGRLKAGQRPEEIESEYPELGVDSSSEE